MADKHAYLVAGKRSPVGKYLGMLSKLSAVEIGAQVGRAVLAEARADLAAFNEVFVGQVLQAGGQVEEEQAGHGEDDGRQAQRTQQRLAHGVGITIGAGGCRAH
ncbi:MAG TPA: hypothetical protein PLQ87_12790, partial [Phycisphaerae bacterium]|nr:hypothetical protein [Phycisphaerae bacterium]